jgi:hypothetical protein
MNNNVTASRSFSEKICRFKWREVFEVPARSMESQADATLEGKNISPTLDP